MDQQIWNGILESERCYRYYHSLSDKFRKRQWCFDVVLLLLTGGIGATLAGHFLQGSTQALALTLLTCVIASIVLWQHIQGYRAKMVAANLISIQYKSLADDWRHQWRIGALNNDEMIIGTLTERLTGIGGQCDLESDYKLSKSAEEVGDNVVVREFTTTTS